PLHHRVAPVQIGLAVVIDEDGRVDVVPGNVGFPGHVVGDQGGAAGVHEGPGRAIGDGHANRLALEGGVVHGRVEIVLAAPFDDVRGPGVAPGPLEGAVA